MKTLYENTDLRYEINAENGLLSICFHSLDTADRYRNVKTLKDNIVTHILDNAQTLQLAGFRVNNEITTNPLKDCQTVTPLYKIGYALNRLSFYYDNQNSDEFEPLSVIDIEYKSDKPNAFLTYKIIRELLYDKGIEVYFDCDPDEIIISSLSSNIKLTLLLAIADRTTTQDSISFLLNRYNSNNCIHHQVLKKLDYKICYDTPQSNDVTIFFNMPIFNIESTISSLRDVLQYLFN